MAAKRVPKFDSSRFLDTLAMKLAAAGKRRAMPHIKSATLRESTVILRRKKSSRSATWAIHMPQYWARFKNYGTKGSRAKKGGLIAFFPNKKDDPRTSGGTDYAVRLSRRRKLKWSSKKIKKAVASGELVLTKKVGPTPAEKFFDNDGGMSGFSHEAHAIAKKEMTKAVKAYLGPDLNIEVTMDVFI